MELRFIVGDTTQSALAAVGAAPPDGAQVERCPFLVGDVIAYPGPKAVAMRVMHRTYMPAGEGRPARWYLHVEQAPHPL